MIELSELVGLISRNRAQAERRIKREVLVPYLKKFDEKKIFPWLSRLHELAYAIDYGGWLEPELSGHSFKEAETAHKIASFLRDLRADLDETVIPEGAIQRDSVQDTLAIEAYGYQRPKEEVGWFMVHSDCFQIPGSESGHNVFRYQLGHVDHADPRFFHDAVVKPVAQLTAEMTPVEVREDLAKNNIITKTGKFFVVRPKGHDELTHSLEHAACGVATRMVFACVKS
jgi:hypothetical protein